MNKKIQLHFAHGNGFPSPCYQQLFNHLKNQFDCCYIDKVGHSAKFPVTENWHYLVDEVVSSISTQATEPVIALGHSLGGILSLLAAIERPSLVRAVILLDSPILGRLKSNVLRFSKNVGIIDRLTPAYRMRMRRQHWQTREEVWCYLKSRALFKTFSDACLEDYIHYGLKKDKEGYSLRFDRQIEYQIYRTIPHVLYNYEGQLKCPAALIYGNKSNVVKRLDLRYMTKYFGVEHIETKGTHMFPMENPEVTANLIIGWVNTLISGRH